MEKQALTYAELLEAQSHRVTLGELNPQTAANRATALRHFMRVNHVQPADVVGPEMRGEFPTAFERLVDEMREQKKSDRSISNTKAALTCWRRPETEPVL